MKKILFAIFFVICLLFIGVFIWWQRGTSAVDPSAEIFKMFVIQPGEGTKSIAKRLEEEGLIPDETAFYLLVKQLGIEQKIQAGDFRLSPAMKPEEIAKTLTSGALDIWVTIPEGKRAEEIADILQEHIPTYDQSWREQLAQHEGYLFPDTYLIPRNADAAMVIAMMRENFDKKYQELSSSTTTNFSQNEIVTIASLIEREAKHDEDRPLVSSVIHNRLQIGMPLQIDATVQYVLGYTPSEKRWWKQGLTYDDLKISSPYNTYENPGLPPGPIANPGVKALEAAMNPAESDYLYYISDKYGQNHYAKTLNEHNANIKKHGL